MVTVEPRLALAANYGSRQSWLSAAVTQSSPARDRVHALTGAAADRYRSLAGNMETCDLTLIATVFAGMGSGPNRYSEWAALHYAPADQ